MPALSISATKALRERVAREQVALRKPHLAVCGDQPRRWAPRRRRCSPPGQWQGSHRMAAAPRARAGPRSRRGRNSDGSTGTGRKRLDYRSSVIRGHDVGARDTDRRGGIARRALRRSLPRAQRERHRIGLFPLDVGDRQELDRIGAHFHTGQADDVAVCGRGVGGGAGLRPENLLEKEEHPWFEVGMRAGRASPWSRQSEGSTDRLLHV